MSNPNLPAAIVAQLAARLDALPRTPLRQAQAQMSAVYRDGGNSNSAVPDMSAALAYSIARMPATYAACVRAFELAALRAPDLLPYSVLDLGAGPGTATLAAAAVWPTLGEATLVEPNVALAAIGRHLVAGLPSLITTNHATDLAAFFAQPSPRADLVTLSYVLAEQPEKSIAEVSAAAAACAGRLIVIVEPGTPAGYARTLQARQALISAGLTIIAPCPHDRACPLPTGDWCHFSVRLQRSAAHMQLKDAVVPFEDERFSFVAAVRAGPITPVPARMIRPATIEKGFVDLALCTTQGLERRRVRRRDGAAYKQARNLAWGDEL